MALTAEQFGKAVVASNLLTAEELRTLWSELPAAERPQDGTAFAKRLIELKKLNDYQAKELLEGRGARLVMGDYALLDKIGEGGMGQVFKARHRRMNRIVALKVMSAAAMKDEAAIKRFQREVHAAARLEHPNIVTAYDSGEAGAVKYLVMQFVDGGDLSDLVKKNGPLPIERAVDYVLQTARGLAFAHGEGVIHRDIKPANLLLDKKGVVKILDMGLARIEGGDGLTATEQVMGTVDYMSPEQAGDTKHVDGRADIYSLGCTLWFLLTGKKLYDGDSMIQRLMKHRTDPLPSLVKTRDDAPWSLEQALHKMIAKERENRFQSMDEVIAALEPFAPSGGSRSGIGSSLGMGSSPQNAELSAFLKTVGPGAKPQVKSAPSGTKVDIEATAQLSGSDVATDPKSEVRPPQNRGQAAKSQANHAGGKPPPNKTMLLAGAGGAALLVLLGVWFIFRDKDGNETARVQMPDGGSVTVQNLTPQNDPRPTGSGAVAKPAPSSTISFFSGTTPNTNSGTPTFVSSASPGVQNLPAGKWGLQFEHGQYVETAPTPHRETNVVTTEVWVTDEAEPTLTGRNLVGKPAASIQIGNSITMYTFHAGNPAGIPKIMNQRVHLAAVSDDKGRRLYVNGKLAAQSDVVGTAIRDKPLPILIGDTKRWRGVIDAVRISTTARYTQDFTPPTDYTPDKETYALYKFDEGQGDVLKDSSGNNYHGKIVGATWVRGGANSPAAPLPFTTTIQTRWPLAASKPADIQWLVGLGAEVTLRTALPSVNSSVDQTIKSATEIPAGAATIVGVHFVAQSTPLTDADFARLCGFINLESLSFDDRGNKSAPKHEITGQGWGNLAALTHLRSLRLEGCRPVTVLPDFMSSLTSLELLNLPYADAAEWARAAAAAPALKNIFARRTQLGDDGLAHLEKRTSLLEIDLRGAHVTQAGIDRFAAALPQCRIKYGDNDKNPMVIEPRVPPPGVAAPAAAPPPGDYVLEFRGFDQNGDRSTWVDVPSLLLSETGPLTLEARVMALGHNEGLVLGTDDLRLRLSGGHWTTDRVRLLRVPIEYKRWHHLAAVRTDGEVRMYVDGKRTDAQPLPSRTGPQPPPKTLPLKIGGNNAQLRMDEIRISRTARYDADFTPAARFTPDADTLALYHCDDGAGVVLKDSSGNGHDGKISKPDWLTPWVQPDGSAVLTAGGSAIPPTGVTPSAIPAEALTFGGHRYLLVANEAQGTWNDCRVKAEQGGGHLAAITSKEEHNWVRDEIWMKRPNLDTAGSCFLGGRILPDRKSGTWVTGEPVDLTLWPGKRGGPDNGDDGKDSIIAISEADGGWDDKPDHGRSSYFLVEWDALDTSAASPLTVAELLDSPDYVWTEPENLGPTVNGPNDQSIRSVTNDELRLYFHRKGGPDGKADELCEVIRTSRDAPFGEPRVVSTGGGYVSGDGLTYVGAGPDISLRQRPSLDAPFGEAINLGPVINSPGDERRPTLSPDGLTLVFGSNRDIPQRPELWMSRRASQAEPFGPPTKFGPVVNAGKSVFSALMFSDGQTLLFRSTDGLHLTFVNPAGIQSSLPLRNHPFADNRYGELGVWIAPDGLAAYFSADRPGGLGGQDIYVTRRVPKPGTAAAAPAPPGGSPGAKAGTIDLLPLVDVTQDKIKGSWELRNGELHTGNDTGPLMLEFPYQPPEEYDFTVEFTYTAGGEIHQFLARQGRGFSWALGAMGYKFSGFERIDGKVVHENPTKRDYRPQINQRHVSRIEVRDDGLRAYLDGNLIGEWKGDYKQLDAELDPRWPFWKRRDPSRLAIGTKETPTIFHKAEVVEIRGSGTFLRPNTHVDPPANAPAPAAGAEVDLLPLVDLLQDVLSGQWTRQGIELHSTVASGTNQKVRLPVDPGEAYSLRVAFAVNRGYPKITLPLESKGLLVSCLGSEVNLALAGPKGGAANPSTQVGISFYDGKRHEVKIDVTRPSADQVRIAVAADGKPALDWTGTREQLRAVVGPDLPEPVLIFESFQTAAETVKLLEAKLTTTVGTMKPLRAAPVPNAGSAALPNAAVPQPALGNAQAVDLLAAIDTARDVRSGSWKKENGLLISVANGYHTLELPTKPADSYRLEMVAERVSGEGALSIGLVVGKSDARLFVDGRAGKEGTESMTGLSDLNGKRFNLADYAGPLYKSEVFPPAARVALQVDVTPGSVTLAVENKQVWQWTGDARAIQMGRTDIDSYKCLPGTLWLGSYNSKYQISRLTYVPNP